MHTLYLCYFGLREPLVQTQVLPYLRQLSEAGIEVSLLTFEPYRRHTWSPEDVEDWRTRLQADGIRWFSLPYHKWPSLPATLYDIVVGAWTALRLVQRHDIHVLHARCHVPMAIGLLVQRWTGCRLIFDCRGLMAEEYADAGVWKEGSPPFRLVKRLERTGFRRADQIVVLTQRMRTWLIQQRCTMAKKIEVIPCCVDFSRFVCETPENTTLASSRFEVVYAGSVTGLYLLEEMGHFFLTLRTRKPDAFFRILTNASPNDASLVLQRIGLNPSDFWIGAVPPVEIPMYLRRARLGLSFRKPTFSQIAASPTKIPEYLAAGLPVLCNTGIGDMDHVLEKEGVGVLVRTFNHEAYAEAAEKVLILAADQELQERCTHAVRQYFDLEKVGGVRYRRLYERLLEKGAHQPLASQARP